MNFNSEICTQKKQEKEFLPVIWSAVDQDLKVRLGLSYMGSFQPRLVERSFPERLFRIFGVAIDMPAIVIKPIMVSCEFILKQ